MLSSETMWPEDNETTLKSAKRKNESSALPQTEPRDMYSDVRRSNF